MDTTGTVAIIPMKPLGRAKSRLSQQLTDGQRMALSLSLLRRVLQAAMGLSPGSPEDSTLDEVWVVGGDEDIRRVATGEGASWFEEEGPGLNETLWLFFQRAFEQHKAALYLPGDLPLVKPRDVDSMLSASRHLRNVALAPARQGRGTNGILVPAELPVPFKPALGPDSFRRHLRQAADSSVSVAICYSPGLAFDLDTFDDLKAYEYMEPGFLESVTGIETR